MRIILIKNDKLINFLLPTQVLGNYWITDLDKENKKRNLVNIEAVNGNWLLKSNFEVKVFWGGSEVDNVILRNNNFYTLKINDEDIVIYTDYVLDKTYEKLRIENNNDYFIGRNKKNDIAFNYEKISDQHLKLEYKNDKYTITDLTNSNLLYVNNVKTSSCDLKFGDIVFLCGLKIIVMKDYILLNKIGSAINYSSRLKLIESFNQELQIDDFEDDINIKPIYSKDDYFHKSPRFKTIIEKEDISIDAPPVKEQDKEMPMLFVVGPMITMSMTSVIFAMSAINNMKNGNGNIWTALPTIVMTIAMISSSALWPSLTRKYEKKQRILREKQRQQKYSAYINNKRNRISIMMKSQTQVLKDNYISPEDCENIILNKLTTLWNRSIEDADFLSLRVGIGTYPLEIDIKYHEEDFMMEEDNLSRLAEELVNETRNLENVPVKYSFKDKFISGIVGHRDVINKFFNSLLLQIATFYSYDEVKIVFLTSEDNEYRFEYLKFLPHLFSNDRQFRFFASKINEKKEISLFLERVFQARKSNDENSYKENKPYFIIISDDYNGIRDLEIIKDVLAQENNIGFSILILEDKLSELPNECENFINVTDKSSGVFESEVASDKQYEFQADFVENERVRICFQKLSNIPIELLEEDSNLPKSLGFLEMYNVGMVEQLNVLNRYKKSNSISSLAAPIGIDKMGQLLYLDLHEKVHGPHGLIAGMTGSGKSEFIITYILSMAVNYSPDDVSFVLIDYKGGGLAGAFHNKETGVKLPHLAGTITNLDISDMNRSLASIQSELRRRQAIFNEARDNFNESTIDIYKYQILFKEGKVTKPVPHLIIIVDEFAELKVQQPEFMDQLISTARIGRSLGVHLILATQKPTGVVNDQIWSNSKFRVCLKVQEQSDSMEMIKVKDAASLKNVGRFYLQVGYNELFALGQSAWCGNKYYPTEKMKKKVDTSISFIDNIGNIIKSSNKDIVNVANNGEEITNILKYIISICKNKSVKKLWLDKIPNVIFVEELKKKYDHKEFMFQIKPIIGEYDDPFNQRQGLLYFDLSDLANYVIYGIAGSGKELLITTMLYSIITSHTPDEVNSYILDCGAGALKIFNKAPHIGDILSVSDFEKIEKLFQFLEKEIENRKIEFSDYAGDYDVYIKNSPKKVPLIVFVLNNYDNFIDSYESYFERLCQLVREGSKYGIITVMTVANPNTLRFHLRQSFKNEVTLQLSDDNEYYNIFGRHDKVVLSECKGRGLIKLDSVYEYQVAYSFEEADLSVKIRNLCEQLTKKYTNKAKAIPVLPTIVNYEYIKSFTDNLKNVPVGVNKNNLKIETFDFNSKNISLITGLDLTTIGSFLNELLRTLSHFKNLSLFVLDAEEIINSVSRHTNNYDGAIDDIYNAVMGKEYTNNYLCFIIGLDSLFSRISVEAKNRLIELFNRDKEFNNLNFVFVDVHSKLKKLDFEGWYRNNVNINAGIWIGNGIVNQYTIVLNKIAKEHRDEIADNFGYIINGGKTTFVKLLENSDDIEVLDE